MDKIVKCTFFPGQFNNYLIAGNVCNAFALGEIGSSDDFFLVGAEPEDESNYPLLTGNILDSEGKVLCRLVRNVLIINPGDCSRLLGDHVGYEIHDGMGNLILRVRTMFEKLGGLGEETFITTITANFYNKEGELVFRANSGEEDEHIESNVKSAFGFSGGFGLVTGLAKNELRFLRMVLGSRGAVHEPVTGDVDGTEFTLDGKAIIDARVTNCKIHIKTGKFVTYGQNSFENCNFVFHDVAANIRNLVLMLEGPDKSGTPV
jgi:hypothetical protein